MLLPMRAPRLMRCYYCIHFADRKLRCGICVEDKGTSLRQSLRGGASSPPLLGLSDAELLESILGPKMGRIV